MLEVLANIIIMGALAVSIVMYLISKKRGDDFVAHYKAGMAELERRTRSGWVGTYTCEEDGRFLFFDKAEKPN